MGKRTTKGGENRMENKIRKDKTVRKETGSRETKGSDLEPGSRKKRRSL